MPLQELGQRFRTIRRAMGLSQLRVADAIGWHQTEISALERGDQVNTSMEKLVRLGQYYGLSPNEVAETAGWWVGPEESPLDFYWNLISEAAAALPDQRKHWLLTRLTNLARGERRAWEQEQERAEAQEPALTSA